MKKVLFITAGPGVLRPQRMKEASSVIQFSLPGEKSNYEKAKVLIRLC